MAKARAIVKRRKAVRNIRKITKTMQMIATAKFQKSLKRAVGTKPYTLKVRELVKELAKSMGDVKHELLRQVTDADRTNRIALLVLTSNRGLAGAYNGSVLRTAMRFVREQEAAGKTIDLYVFGRKGYIYFTFQKRAVAGRNDKLIEHPRYIEIEEGAAKVMKHFTEKQVDSVHVAYMNFISTGVQRPEVLTLLPLGGVEQAVEHLAQQAAEKEAAAEVVGSRATPDLVRVAEHEGAGRLRDIKAQPAELHAEVIYDFSPSAGELLDYLLPLTVKTALFQAFLDASTSENVARMVAMKSATDNADKMSKALTMQYNRARQSQITTELSEIMGGVEAMKG